MLSPLNEGFDCKICGKKYATFQALGGHVSSHARHTLSGEEAAKVEVLGRVSGFSGRNSNKVHECSICKIRFAMGQSLGGHMRRHYVLNDKRKHGSDADEKKKKKIQKIGICEALFKSEDDEVNKNEVKTESLTENDKRGFCLI